VKRAVVLGAGIAGLSAACHLAHGGAKVTVLERHDQPGGRARVWEQDGFRFDLGPSWYWMPDLFEAFFATFGRRVPDLYELVRLDPSYRVVWPGGEAWDVPAGVEALRPFFAAREPGGDRALDAFLKESGWIYQVATQEYLNKPSLSFWEYADVRLPLEAMRLQMFTSMDRRAAHYFRDPRLQRLVSWPVLFLGAPSSRTPAMYSLMAYADLALGTWYPKGGIHQVIKAMAQVAAELGVEIRLGADVAGIEVANGRATGVRLASGEAVPADVVVGAADYHHVESLLPPAFRQYSESWWDRRQMSPSSLLLYLGVEGRVDLPHHTLFFDEDLDRHMDEVYGTARWPERPLFYVCTPSRTDPGVAPPGCENLFVLVPLAPGLPDDEAERDRVAAQVLSKIEARIGHPLKIRVQRRYAMRDFVEDYRAYKGNAYGMANTLLQSGPFKPPLRSRKVPNLVFAGQLTVPGPGMPPSLISGGLAARVALGG
jgi:phytoene desaturase